MAKQSSVNLDITNNADGFDISGGTTVRKLGITGGDVTIAGSGSAVVTFPTTSTTIAGLGITQSFSALQSFSAGISAAGATLSSISVVGACSGGYFTISQRTSDYLFGTNLPTNIIYEPYNHWIFLGLDTVIQNTSGNVGIGDGDYQVNGTRMIINDAAGTIDLYAEVGATWTWNNGGGNIDVYGYPIFNDNITANTANFVGLLSASNGISASGATFSGNISAPNIVTSVNGATGSVTTYAGTTGNIQVRYGSGITATNYFDLAEGNLGQITDILTLSGATDGNAYYGNQQALELQFERGCYGLGLDESGGVVIRAKGIYNDGGVLYGANLHLETPVSDSGSSIIFHAAGGEQFTVSPTYVYSGAQHIFNNGIESQSAGYTNNFAGPITGVTATFTGSVILKNQEFIRNTTNGRMDFMPAPAGSTHYGMYMDFTSWSYGVKLGTIRASDNATNAAGFLFESSITIGNNVRTSLGSNGQNGIVLSDTGNDTIQLYTSTTSGTNSGAIAIVDLAGQGAANRSPGVTHANPNLYVYRAGSASANDFVRMEHDGTNGRIVSGGTSGIKLELGSGIVGVSGNIQVLQNQIYVTNNARSWFL